MGLGSGKGVSAFRARASEPRRGFSRCPRRGVALSRNSYGQAPKKKLSTAQKALAEAAEVVEEKHWASVRSLCRALP